MPDIMRCTEASDACMLAFRHRDNDTFIELVEAASRDGYLGWLLGHWVGVWHQARPYPRFTALGSTAGRNELDETDRAIATVKALLAVKTADELDAAVDEVASWSATDRGVSDQIRVSVVLCSMLDANLPPAVLPSHCLILADAVGRAGEQLRDPGLGRTLLQIATQLWHSKSAATAMLTDADWNLQQLRQAVTLLAHCFVQQLTPGTQFTVTTGDPARYTTRDLRMIQLGVRVVQLYAAGQARNIDRDLATNLPNTVETRILVLTLAVWLTQRIGGLPPYQACSQDDAIQKALDRL